MLPFSLPENSFFLLFGDNRNPPLPKGLTDPHPEALPGTHPGPAGTAPLPELLPLQAPSVFAPKYITKRFRCKSKNLKELLKNPAAFPAASLRVAEKPCPRAGLN